MRFPVTSWLVIGAVVASTIIPASAQVPPPSRDRGDGNDNVPKYVDSADYDRQPYYVDGVQYKPYAADGKKAKASATTTTAAQAPVYVQSSSSASSETYAPGELHPFVPQQASAASSSSSRAPVVAQASASSSAPPVVYTPEKRPRFGSAVIEALDKVTAESVRFEAPIGSAVRYKGLIYIVKACELSADDEAQPDVMAYVQVRTNPVAATNTAAAVKSKEIFHGWMFASSPSLNPLQHPVYDAWVVGCRRPLA